VITDPTRALARMVGSDDATFLAVEPGEATTVHVESHRQPTGCPDCGSLAQGKDREVGVLVDFPVYGRPSIP